MNGLRHLDGDGEEAVDCRISYLQSSKRFKLVFP